MKIGIDLISSMKIVDDVARYTGGTNYAKAILKCLINSNKLEKAKWILYIPEGFIIPDEDRNIFDNRNFERRYAKAIDDCNVAGVDVLFLPQVNGDLLTTIPRIKKEHSELKIYATLHDRQHNFYKYDWTERYYYKGVKHTGIPGFLEYYIKRLAFRMIYGHAVKYIDKIFTVSNYSMQKLMHKNIKNIKFYVQENIIQCDEIETSSREDYILFVGGGRPEKNLLRTLTAFQKYKEISKKNYRLVITGVSNQLQQQLIAASGVNDDTKKYIEFTPYLSYDELKRLYANCRYTVFTSKGEGYGLPVREALSYGKAIIASRTTSVPEVAGAALYYVDPFDVESIASGFEKFDSDTFLDRYERYARERKQIVEQTATQDMNILIDELMEEIYESNL